MISLVNRIAGVPAALRLVVVPTPEDEVPNLPTALDNMDVQDVELVTFDWSSRVSTSDQIISATVTATPAGLTLGVPTVFGALVQIELGPAASVDTYDVHCTIRTQSGRVLNWPATLFATNL